MVSAADELFGVGQNRLARSEHDQSVFTSDAIVPVEVVLLERFFGWYRFFDFICTPDMFHVIFGPDVVETVIVLRRLFAEEVLPQRNIVARCCQMFSLERVNDDVALLHFFQDSSITQGHMGTFLSVAHYYLFYI